MIFVVKSGIKRDGFDTIALREKLYKELNQEGTESGRKASGCYVTKGLYV